MDIKTKFSIGDKFYHVYSTYKTISLPCDACDGIGKVTILSKQYPCPKCYGRKYITMPSGLSYNVNDIMTVGKIIIEVTERLRYEDSEPEFTYQYMAYESGFPSGPIYREEEMFSSEIEAENRCKELNEELKKKC